MRMKEEIDDQCLFGHLKHVCIFDPYEVQCSSLMNTLWKIQLIFISFNREIYKLCSLPTPLNIKLANIPPFPTTDAGQLQRPKRFHAAKNAFVFYKQEACQANCSWQESRSYILSLSTSGRQWPALISLGSSCTQSCGRASVPSGLRPPDPRHLRSPPSPACGLGSSASSPPGMTFLLSFPNYLLLFIWNLNIWEALRDQICRGHSPHS